MNGKGVAKVARGSRLTKAICADLLERSPAAVAFKRRMTIHAVYAHRRRFELRNGVELPRLHKAGRPRTAPVVAPVAQAEGA